MTARTITETTLIAYHLGDLDAAARAAVESCLAESPDLRAELAAIQVFHRELRTALTASTPEAMPPERVWNALMPNLPQPRPSGHLGNARQAVLVDGRRLVVEVASRMIAGLHLLLGALLDYSYGALKTASTALTMRLAWLIITAVCVSMVIGGFILAHRDVLHPSHVAVGPSAACGDVIGGAIHNGDNTCAWIASTPRNTAVQSTKGVELLSQPWHLAGNNGAAEAYQDIEASVLYGRDTLRITYDLHGLTALGGDASAIIFDQGGWRSISLSDYGKNGLDGSQVVEIPLSDFQNLDTNAPVATLRARIWYSGPFVVDITSIVADVAQGEGATLATTASTPTPSTASTPTAAAASATPQSEPQPVALSQTPSLVSGAPEPDTVTHSPTMVAPASAPLAAASPPSPAEPLSPTPTTTPSPHTPNAATARTAAIATSTPQPSPSPTGLSAAPATGTPSVPPAASAIATPATTQTPTTTPAPAPPCRSTPGPTLDVVLVLDHSGSMRGEKLRQAQATARRLVEVLNTPDDQVGLVTFAAKAKLVAPLADDPSAAERAIETIAARGGTDLAAGIILARQELEGERHHSASLPMMIILSDGDAPIAAATRQATEAKMRGIRIIAVRIGRPQGKSLLPAIASEDNYFEVPPTLKADDPLPELQKRLRPCDG